MPKIVVNGTTYTVKELMSWADIREGRKSLRELLEIAENIQSIKGDDVELNKASKVVIAKTDDQDEIMFNTLKKYIVEDLSNIKYVEALFLYSELFKISQDVPKNFGKPATSASE